MRSLTRNRLFKKNPFKKALAATVMSAALMTGSLANPSGPVVRNGQVNISGLGGAQLQIEQLTNKAIVNWDSFSIGAGEAVRFLQPSQMALILNRVTGQDPSQILGSLSANGQVFLINPNGILFGPGSQVNVGSLVASSLQITDQDFLNGNYNFTQDASKELASVINQGTIRVSDGGYAVLTAPLVSNEGLIVANLGKVVLAGGEQTTLNFDGRDLINFEVGALPGEAGTVVLPREAVGGILADMLGAEDRAGQLIRREDGTLALEGGSGTVYQAGTIRADGSTGEKAGSVVIDSTRLTVLGENSVTAADGVGQNSEGGEVLALSNLSTGTTVGYAGSHLSAQGGESGDGGFIEFSGSKFSLGSSIDATAQNGTMGTFLLDPRDIFVIDGPSGASPLPGPPAPADLTINDGTIETLLAGAQVTLQADRNIDFANGVSINVPTGNFIALADADNNNNGTVTVNQATINVNSLELTGNGIFLNSNHSITANTAVLTGRNFVEADSTGATLNVTNLGLVGSSIRGSGASDIISLNATNLAIQQDAGSFYLFLNDTGGGLNIVNSITGLTQTATTGGTPSEFDITASGGGDLTIGTALSGNFGYIRADGNVTLQADLNITDQFLIIADNDNNGVGGIIQTAGTVTTDALGLSAGLNGIGSAGSLTNGLQVNTRELAIGLPTGGLPRINRVGNVNVVDTAGGVTIVDSVDASGEVLDSLTVNGNFSTGSMQVTARGGDTANLTVAGAIDSVGTNLELSADNDVIFDPMVTATVTGSAIIRADLDNNNDGTITFSDGSANSHISAQNLGLALSENFGTAGVEYNIFTVDADPNGDGTGGTVFVNDSGGDFTIGSVSGPNQTISNLRGAGDTVAQADGGNLLLNAPASSSTGDVHLAAVGNVALGANVSAATGQEALVRANTGTGSITQTSGSITGQTVGLLAQNVGTNTRSININADNLVVNGGGSIYVSEADSVNLIADITAAGSTFNQSPLSAGGDFRVFANNNLNVNNQVQGTDVSLIANTGNLAVNQNVTATGNAVLSAGGNISGTGTVTAPNLGLDAANIGAAGANLMIDADNLAVDSEANAFVQDSDDVTLVNQVTSTSFNPGIGGGGGDVVTGNDATGDFALLAGGNITVNDTVTGGDTVLRTTGGNIVINQGVGDAGTVDTVLSASGTITGSGTVTSQNLGLSGSTIGTSGANPLSIATNNVSVLATGSAFLSDPNDLTMINQVQATANNDTVTGNQVGQQLSVVAGNNLTVADDVRSNSGAGILEFVATNNVSFTNNAGDAADATVPPDDGRIIVVAQNGSISQEQGGLLNARTIGLRAGTDIGTSGGGTDNNAIDLVADRVAVVAGRHANVLDTSANLSTSAGVAGITQNVAGFSTGGNLELEVAAGALDHSSGTITVGGNADVVANNTITLATPINITGNGVFTSTNGDVLASPGAGQVISADQLGFNGRNIGEDIGAVSPLQVSANSVAYNATGQVFLRDNVGDLQLVASVTGVDETANGATSGNQTSIEAQNGNLTVATNVVNNNAGATGIDLIAQGNVALNGSVSNTNGNVVVVADSNNSGTGAISQGAGQSVNAVGVGLTAGNGGIGTPGADSNAVAINATNLSLETSGSANVRDTAGGLTLVNNVTGFNRSVTGTTLNGSLELEANGGDGATLTIADDITGVTNADLVADDDVIINNALTASGNVVVRADNDSNNNGGITNTGSITSAGLGLAAAENIDNGAGGPLLVNVDNFAGVSTGGNVNVQDQSGTLTIANVTGVDESVNGAQAATDLAIRANGTDLTLNAPATAGRNIDLVANQNVNLNANVNSTGGTGTVVIAADADGAGGVGSITQTEGNAITGNRVGLSAQNDIGGVGAGDIETNANEIVIETAASAYVDNAGAVRIVDSAAGQLFTVTGNVAANDYRLGAGGQITVDDAVQALDIALVTTSGGIVVNQNVGGDTQDVVLSTPGDITGDGVVGAVNVGLRGNNIGTSANSFDVRAQNLAVNSTRNSYVNDPDSITIVDSVTATGVNDMVTGNLAAGDYRVSAGGAITVNDGINGNDVSLVTTNGTITANQTIISTQDLVLNAGGAGQSILQGGGTLVGQNIGLQAANQISATTLNEELSINATNLVANAGNVLIVDTAGGVNIATSVTSTAVGDTVNSNGGNNFRVIANGGSLGIGGSVGATNALQLLADNDINQNANITAQTAILKADNNNDGSGALTQTQGNSITADAVGLSAGDGGIGTAGSDINAFDILADTLTLETSGNANVLDSAGGLSVVNSTAATTNALPGETVTGNTVGGSLEIKTTGGNAAALNIQSNVQIGTNGELVADDDIVVGGNITATGSLVLKADNDQNDNGGINRNPQSPAVVTATNLGLQSSENIGDPNGTALEVNVTTLAVDTDPNTNQVGGGVNIVDNNGDLILGTVTGVNESVAVARSAGSLKIQATNGNLNVGIPVTSGQETELGASGDLNLSSNVNAGGNFVANAGRNINQTGNISSGGDVALQATGNISLGGSVQATNGNTVVVAGGNLTVPSGTAVSGRTLNQVGNPTITTNQLGIQAGTDAGSLANPVLFNAGSLTYNVGNNIIAEDTAGGVTLVNQVVAAGTTVNGLTAGNDSRIVANNGDLTVNATSTIGGDGELVTKGSGNIVVNQDYTAATGNVVLRSAGDISGSGSITARGLGIDAPNGTAGTNANPLSINADTLTVGSRPFAVRPQKVFQRAPEVTAIVETVKDVGVIVVPGQPNNPLVIDGNVFAQDNVGLVEAVLEEALDNYDLIYNETGWQVLEDDGFGTNRR